MYPYEYVFFFSCYAFFTMLDTVVLIQHILKQFYGNFFEITSNIIAILFLCKFNKKDFYGTFFRAVPACNGYRKQLFVCLFSPHVLFSASVLVLSLPGTSHRQYHQEREEAKQGKMNLLSKKSFKNKHTKNKFTHRIKDDRMDDSINGSRDRHNLR